MPEIKVRQEEIEVRGDKFFVTHIPTATSGGWYVIHDLFDMWGAVTIDIDGEVVGWRNPPAEEYRSKIEEAIKKVFEIPER